MGEEQFSPAAHFFPGKIYETAHIFKRDPRTLFGPLFDAFDAGHGGVKGSYRVSCLSCKFVPFLAAAPLRIRFSAAGKEQIFSGKGSVSAADPLNVSIGNKHFIDPCAAHPGDTVFIAVFKKDFDQIGGLF